jgi:hypothetical protein
MSAETRKRIEELLNRSIPYDPLYMRTWIIEVKEVLDNLITNEILSNDGAAAVANTMKGY